MAIKNTKSGRDKKSGGSKGQGMCCGYCADSKFPCVTMEKLMRTAKDADEHDEPSPDRD